VADVFRRHFEAYRHSHVPSREQDKVARDLVACRTAVLGGTPRRVYGLRLAEAGVQLLPQPPLPQVARPCARPAGSRQRLTRILPVHHFHVVFTLPSDLADLARDNRALVFDLLIKAAAGSLLALGRDRRFWGEPAQIGVTAVLHTWTRDLRWHPHVHCIVSGGGLARDDGRWISAARDFLFPVHVLGAIFRGKVLAGIEELRAQGKLRDELE
jgi:hypothetical protein